MKPKTTYQELVDAFEAMSRDEYPSLELRSMCDALDYHELRRALRELPSRLCDGPGLNVDCITKCINQMIGDP